MSLRGPSTPTNWEFHLRFSLALVLIVITVLAGNATLGGTAFASQATSSTTAGPAQNPADLAVPGILPAKIDGITVTKTPSTSTVQWDDTFTYEIEVSNVEAVPFDLVALTDTLTGGAQITEVKTGNLVLDCGTLPDVTFTCPIGTLSVGTTAFYTVTVTNGTGCGAIDNVAIVTIDGIEAVRDDEGNGVISYDANFSECQGAGIISATKSCLATDDDADFGFTITNQYGIPAGVEQFVHCDEIAGWLVPDGWDYEVHETTRPAPWEVVPSQDCVDLHPDGEDNTCTIENDRDEQDITVYKQCLGMVEGNPQFEIELYYFDGGQEVTFDTWTVGCNEAANFYDVPSDNEPYFVRETILGGAHYVQTEGNCNDHDSGNGTDIADPQDQGSGLYPVSNETVSCFIENTPETEIEVEKVCVPSSFPGDFVLTVDGTDQTTYHDELEVDCDSGVQSIYLLPGTYEVGEEYDDTLFLPPLFSEDCSIDIPPFAQPGSVGVEVELDVPHCTVTNERGTGTIEIIKNVVPGTDPQDFAFTDDIPSPCVIGPLDDDPGSGTPSSTLCTDVLAGSYTVSENAIAGWDLISITCTTDLTPPNNSSGSVATRTATINLEPGETVRCTFVNQPRGGDIPEDPDGSITIIKLTTGPTNRAFKFSSLDLADFQLHKNDSRTFNYLGDGDYVVSEVVPNGWELVSIKCDSSAVDIGAPTVVISIVRGSHVTCTYTNRSVSTPEDPEDPTATPTNTPTPTVTPKPVNTATPTQPSSDVGGSIVPPNTGDGGLKSDAMARVALLLAGLSGVLAIGLRVAGVSLRKRR